MIPRDFPGKGKVAVLKTSPETVLDDYGRLMDLAGYKQALPKDHETILKINISWQTWYPACSSAPWQIEGVARKLQRRRLYGSLRRAQQDGRGRRVRGREKQQAEGCGGRIRAAQRTPVRARDPLGALHAQGAHAGAGRIFPEGILLPEYFFDKNIIHLPTVKTHVFTVITGAMKNAFGGLLNEKRHWTHGVIHETVVDLLAIQQEIHSGLFAVMDGTFAGDGPGPRAMRWHEKDILLASADQVAIDAVSAKLQGFNPMDLKFIRLGHELGLGVGDPREIEIVGYDTSAEDWGFVQEDTFASKGQKLIYHGALKPFENLLLRSPLVPWSYFASNFYHNVYWYPFVGRPRVEAALDTKWGRLFSRYGDGKVVMPGMEPRTVAVAAGATAAVALGLLIAGGLIARGARGKKG